MEENKAEKLAIVKESIKYYCRVCTCNTKSKKNKSEDCIGIFEKAGLKSILEKYLHLQISEDDEMPKIVCKVCFDKLMAIEFLQIVAKRTDNLFRDLLKKKIQEVTTAPEGYYAANSELVLTKTQQSNIKSKPDEVVVDISMSDPLTKDIRKKLQVAQCKRDSIGMAFSPDHINRNAVTSSPIVQVPVTIVHQMPKKRKTVPKPMDVNHMIPQSNTTTVTLENPSRKKLPTKRPTNLNTPPLRHISEAPTMPQNVEIHPVITGNPPAMGTGMPLGSIIKDEDLLKLILKALKWPYNSQTLDIQIKRLKDTNFHDVLVDPNLLQDTDLIQILGPLIAPIPMMRQQQTYHITIPPDTMAIPPTTMSYKLPAETSVQIITVPAEETEKLTQKQRQPKCHTQTSSMKKRRGRVGPPQIQNNLVIVVSDESDCDEHLKSFGVQLDPALYPSIGDNSNSNETMLATLNRQREAMMRMHRRKRKQRFDCSKNMEMVDDITIVDEGFHMDDEPYHVKKPGRSHDILPVASTSQPKQRKEPVKKNFALPSVPPKQKQYATLTSKTPTIVKSIQSKPENSNTTKTFSTDATAKGFVKVKDQSNLPPLKKVKLLPRSPSYVQVKEPSKLSCLSKNTTLADADSTTKIVTKEKKAPKPAKHSLDIEISKEMTEGNNSSSRSKEVAVTDEVFIVMDCDEKSMKDASVSSPAAKKKDYKILGTVSLSDDEMEPLHVEEVSGEPSLDEQTTIVEEAQSAIGKLPSEPIIESVTAVDLPAHSESASAEIKKEDNLEVRIKEENIESIGEGDHNVDYGASKTEVKSETPKPTRSTTKRKVPLKEELPKEITTFRPARKSKTLSKYYKGPPLSGTAGRSMRSRT